jgi:ADP-L-glycero-D-manno-heptose 6-epimerase
MNIVTGYKGFIGSNIYNRVDNPYGVEIDEAFDFLENFDLWKEVKTVYHLGAISDTTENDVEKIYRYNVQFTLKLMEKCLEHKIPIKYASSASVYGNMSREINPLNQYAMSKAIVDYYVRDNGWKFKKIHGFRLFNVYGNGEDHKGNQSSPITKFKKEALEKGTITVFENSNRCERDFICVEDVCDRIIDCSFSNGIFDLGTSRSISFLKVAELIRDKYGGEIKTIPFPEHLRGKYQYFTMARPHFLGKFKSIKQWLDANP